MIQNSNPNKNDTKRQRQNAKTNKTNKNDTKLKTK